MRTLRRSKRRASDEEDCGSVVAVMLLALGAPAFAARTGERGLDPFGNFNSGYTSRCAYEAQGSGAQDCR